MKKLKIPKQISVKVFLATLFATILFVSCIFYVFAPNPTERFYISGGVYPASLDYIVWREGSNFFVKDNYGAIQSDNSNASTLLQATLDLCANSSDMTVYVKAASYPLDHGLTVDLRTGGSGNFKLIGESGAILTSNTALSGGVWSCFLEVYEGDGVTVKGLTFNDGNSGTAYGIHFSGYGGTNNTLVAECNFYNFIHPSTTYLGIAVTNHRGHNYKVVNNYFENCEQGAVCEANGEYMTHVDISHNTFVGCGHSVNLEIQPSYGGAAITIEGNTITGSDVYTRGWGEGIAGINVFAQSDSSVYHNLAWSITGNLIRFRPAENATGIRVTKCPAISITGNTIANTHYNDTESYYRNCGAIQVRGSPGAVVSGNMIYNGTVGINIYQYTYDPDYMTITGNVVRSMTGAGFFLHRAMYNVFSGNVAQNCGTWGFEEYYTGQTVNNTYVGCHALDCTTGGISVIDHASNNVHVVACWNGTEWIATYP